MPSPRLIRLAPSAQFRAAQVNKEFDVEIAQIVALDLKTQLSGPSSLVILLQSGAMIERNFSNAKDARDERNRITRARWETN